MPAPGPLPAGIHRDALIAEVRRALEVVAERATVVVALSGGPDSTALAYLTAEARRDLDVRLAHVRHGLRDDRADVAVVERHAAALGAPLAVARATVVPSDRGLEAAAREARYAALAEVASDAGAAAILVGHTADDQAETVLLRLARGTGLDGIAGMMPVRRETLREGAVDIVRPLLRVRRTDVRRFVEREGLRAVEDPMNVDRSSRRVRARNEVLPVLGELAADPVGAIGRLAELARDDATFLERWTAECFAGLHRRYGPGRALPHAALREAERGLARRLVRHLVVAVTGDPLPPDAARIEEILELSAGGALDVSGASVTCGGGWIAAVPHGLQPPQPVAIAVPGTTRWEAADLEIVATTPTEEHSGQLRMALEGAWSPPGVRVPEDAIPPGGDRELGAIVLGRVGGELTARARRPGDRIRTPAGTRKLQDVLVDAGVPRALRDLVPVVVRGGSVVWVPGVAVDVDVAAEGRARPGLHLAVWARV